MEQDYLVALARTNWRNDRKDGKEDNTYTRRTRLGGNAVDAARFDDYLHGFLLGCDENPRSIEYLVPAYKREHHGEIVDVAAFKLGYERGRQLRP
jgi:hypothetical protein